MDKPLLSICIPTYNRSEYLKRSIESIICQKEFLEGKVEIVVSDNTSEDDTGSVVKAYCDQFDNVYYYRNTENIRDQNFPLALSRGHGVLRRVCNDTLLYLPGSLGEMCGVIESCLRDKPFICWANGDAMDKQEVLRTDFHGYVRDISFYMTSLGCFSIWDEECEDIQKDTDGCELSLWQVRKGLELASHKNTVLVSNVRYTDTQVVEKKNISYGLYKVFCENFFSLVKPYVESHALSQEDFAFLEEDILFRFFLYWCARWELRDKSLEYSKTENLKESIRGYYREKPYWRRYQMLYAYRLCTMGTKKVLKRLLNR